ncbi:hypothetical protein LTR70_001007 [Exophiala xenobiotica]|uniref:Uncharacterized protein n=1 Tax=Lithohypha guttulata TaxID=1690604 RepID=A0ABR0KQ21_9EURO|nr:hypothetical protein LTR24_000804 [Lithohypha guttulata]KAK5328853.1 hypothetical protein LTR70_001007 [Exophiala xenobiotica]
MGSDEDENIGIPKSTNQIIRGLQIVLAIYRHPKKPGMVVVTRIAIRLLLLIVSIFNSCFDHRSHMAEKVVLVGCGRLPCAWRVVRSTSTSAYYDL